MPTTCPKCDREFPGHTIGHHAQKCGISPAELFWAKVKKGDGCWLWAGAKHFRGYGACAKKCYGDTRAHRVSWLLTNGPIPEGQGVLHRCNTPLCVNPAHLYLGDQKQNCADRIASGRRGNRYMPVSDLLHPHLSLRGQLSRREP